ncbi:peptidylprolyl isomerase [Myroides sp. LJL116]
MKKMTGLLFSIIALFTACTSTQKTDLPDGLYAEIITNQGVILADLEYQKAPVTVANFVSLAEGENPYVDEKYKGKKYFDNVKFHRVVPNFVIQAGDPTATGAGGPGYVFMDEFSPELRHDKAGTLSMANSGPYTNGSQFFITHRETPHLDDMHSVFGYVIKGMDVVNKISEGTDFIKEIKIIRVGKEAKKFNAAKVFKNAMVEQAKLKEQQNKEKEQQAKALDKVKQNKAQDFKDLKSKATTTASGLSYVITETQKDNQTPNIGQTIGVNYAGYFENGLLFDSNIPEITKEYDMFDQRRADYNQYRPIPFKYGAKTGLIPGFIEGIEQMKMGDKATIFIPSHLAYGQAGVGPIPPNTDLVFELELVEAN